MYGKQTEIQTVYLPKASKSTSALWQIKENKTYDKLQKLKIRDQLDSNKTGIAGLSFSSDRWHKKYTYIPPTVPNFDGRNLLKGDTGKTGLGGGGGGG
jgi:hypothetical protein